MNQTWLLLFVLLPIVTTAAHLEMERPQGADVADDTSGYTAIQTYSPRMDSGNGYRSTLLDLSNGHPAGTVLDVRVDLLDDHGRFLLDPGGFNVEEGATQIVEIVDEDQTAGNHTVTITIETDFLSTRTVGSSTMERTVEVKVE